MTHNYAELTPNYFFNRAMNTQSYNK